MQKNALIESATVCYHCGDDCRNSPVIKDEKTFCCEGCSTVYSILKDNNLCTYYNIESTPGLKNDKLHRSNKYAYLDNEEIHEKLIRFSNDEFSTVIFKIPSIHCSSCIWLLENLYKLAEGINSSRVNFMRKEITIQFDEQLINLRKIVELMVSIGYEPEINLEIQSKQSNHLNSDRKLIYKIGVAGFCFGNIMLLSFPEYLGLDHVTGKDFQKLFSYLNLILALPVFFYCATDYYKSAWAGLRQRNLNLDIPVTLGIIALFSRSVFEIVSGSGAGYMDTMAGLLFFMLAGKWFQSRTYEQLSFERDYKSYFPIAVSRIANGIIENISIDKAQKGDVLKIYHDELIPTDAQLLSDSAEIDYSFVSGESVPIKVRRDEQIYSGGRLKSAAVEVKVVNKVSQSYLTSLWNRNEDNQKHEATLADKLSQYFTPVVLVIAFVTALYWGREDWGMAALAFTSVLIVACPCALALSTPFTLGNAMRMLGRNRFYLKNPAVIERMANTSHIVFDKTGTLSLNEDAKIDFVGNSLTPSLKAQIAELCAQSSHPVSRLIYQYLGQKDSVVKLDEFREIVGKGLEGIIDGNKIKLGNAEFIGVENNISELARSFVSINGELIGYFKLEYNYRKGLSGLINKLKEHYSLSLISGDHNTDRKILEKWFGFETPLLFRQSPHDKLQYIEHLRREGEKIIMIGDGLNDAGALIKSDVGIAVADDINNFSPACDVIMDAKMLPKFDVFLKYSTKSVLMVKVAFALSLIYNSIGITFAISGMLSPLLAAVLMPISSVSIVAFGTLSTWLLARKYGFHHMETQYNNNKETSSELRHDKLSRQKMILEVN